MPTFKGEAMFTVMVDLTVTAENQEEADRKARAIQIDAEAWEGSVAVTSMSYNAAGCTLIEDPEA